MIEKLAESAGGVIGFKVVGRVSAEDADGMVEQIQVVIRARGKRPIGILADLSEMDGIDLDARWEEIRFLQKYSLHIARMAVVGRILGRR